MENACETGCSLEGESYSSLHGGVWKCGVIPDHPEKAEEERGGEEGGRKGGNSVIFKFKTMNKLRSQLQAIGS